MDRQKDTLNDTFLNFPRWSLRNGIGLHNSRSNGWLKVLEQKLYGNLYLSQHETFREKIQIVQLMYLGQNS